MSEVVCVDDRLSLLRAGLQDDSVCGKLRLGHLRSCLHFEGWIS